MNEFLYRRVPRPWWAFWRPSYSLERDFAAEAKRRADNLRESTLRRDALRDPKVTPYPPGKNPPKDDLRARSSGKIPPRRVEPEDPLPYVPLDTGRMPRWEDREPPGLQVPPFRPKSGGGGDFAGAGASGSWDDPKPNPVIAAAGAGIALAAGAAAADDKWIDITKVGDQSPVPSPAAEPPPPPPPPAPAPASYDPPSQDYSSYSSSDSSSSSSDSGSSGGGGGGD